MTEQHDELLEIATRLERLKDRGLETNIQEPLSALEKATTTIGKSWNGSWLGYHASIYYENFEPTPPGAHFSQEWGFKQLHSIPTTTGNWVEVSSDDVEKTVYELANDPNLDPARQLAEEAAQIFENDKSEILSILTTALVSSGDSFLENVKNDVEEFSILSRYDVINGLKPSSKIMTRDMVALGQGLRTPPHIYVLSEVISLRHSTGVCGKLGGLARKAGSHISRQQRHQRREGTIGTNVFIGHGSSPLWKDLKDFVQDRLGLPWDEFNRVPVAGITNISRLSEMLDAAAIAFLVMTGEDEQADGDMHARMNVVHEAGLFQGRLGFSKAIVLLEEECAEFSNIHGLGQIRFPKNNIKAAFEDIRQVLEREKIIDQD